MAAAGRAALAFREVRVLAVTRKQAITDELTGLANRRRLGERMDELIASSQVSGRPLAFLLIDLDGFKELNDTLGHKAGDMLRQIGPRLAAAERLHLEITENLVMAAPRRTMEVLGALRALGVGLSLDDFGTGQTSLAYLRKLSLDEIKIDRSFVLELGHDEDAAAIVRSTVQMAQALRLRVVAEGAEDAAAMRRLREFGCELVQGFFLSPPLPAAEITEWLRAQASAPLSRSGSSGGCGSPR